VVARHYLELEKRIAEKAAAIVTVADPLTRYFRDHHGCRRVRTVFSGFDPKDFFETAAGDPFPESGLHIVHTGRFGLSDSGITAAPFFQAVRDVLSGDGAARKKLRIHLAGELSPRERGDIADLIKGGWVVDHGMLSRRESLALQGRADLLLIITQPTRTSAVSAKIFEYLYARRPILALTHETTAAQIVKETGSGWIVHPHDPSAVAALLSRLVNDPGVWKEVSLDMADIMHFSWNNQASVFSELLNDIGMSDTMEDTP
jgi:glycosyltransferase involved in cell wall biosynthesis